MSTRAKTAAGLIRAARTLVVVHDGAYKWAGDRKQVYEWLRRKGISRGYDNSYNVPNAAHMHEGLYERLCDETACYVDTSGSYGPTGADVHELIEAIENGGAELLYIL